MAQDVDSLIEEVTRQAMADLATAAYRDVPVVPVVTRNTPTACVVWKEVDNKADGNTLDNASEVARVVISVAAVSQRRELAARLSRELADSLNYRDPPTITYDGIDYEFDRLEFEGRRVDYNGALDLWQGEVIMIASVSGDEEVI